VTVIDLASAERLRVLRVRRFSTSAGDEATGVMSWAFQLLPMPCLRVECIVLVTGISELPDGMPRPATFGDDSCSAFDDAELPSSKNSLCTHLSNYSTSLKVAGTGQ
jgi:hypothetical protein